MIAFSHSNWFMPLNRAKNPQGQVIFFPHAGGSAHHFSRFSPYFDQPVRLLALELPGKGSRINEEPFKQFDQLTEVLTEALAQLNLDNTIFLGHSMGALIAYDCAKKLEHDYARQIKALVVSGLSAPCYHNEMHYLDPDVDDHTLISELRKIQGLPDTILQYPDMLQIILQTIRTDCRLIRSYRHQILTKKLCSQLICITASEDTVASESKCEKWSAETTNTFTSLKINGGHFALYENIEKIAILLRSVLDDDSYTRV